MDFQVIHTHLIYKVAYFYTQIIITTEILNKIVKVRNHIIFTRRPNKIMINKKCVLLMAAVAPSLAQLDKFNGLTYRLRHRESGLCLTHTVNDKSEDIWKIENCLDHDDVTKENYTDHLDQLYRVFYNFDDHNFLVESVGGHKFVNFKSVDPSTGLKGTTDITEAELYLLPKV